MKRSAEMPGSGGDDSVVVVSGASGLVGRALVAELLRRGHAVRRLVRRPVRFEDERRWDATTGTLDADALRGARAVVHLAGAGIGDQRWTPARRVEIRESRVQGTSTLARAMVTMRDPPVWVSGSAIGIYGDRGNEELDETSAAGAGFLADVCQEWEAATAPVTASGGRVVLLRTGVVLARQGGRWSASSRCSAWDWEASSATASSGSAGSRWPTRSVPSSTLSITTICRGRSTPPHRTR